MNDSAVLQTLADLVRINSINPAYEGGQSEAGVVAYLRDFFAARGIETWEQEVFPGRPNLIARLPGKQPGRRVILEAHTDTVSVKGMTIPPFEPTIANGRLYGRGSCDTKAGLAGMMHAIASLKTDGITPPCEIWLAAAADEEFSYRGVVRLCGMALDGTDPELLKTFDRLGVTPSEQKKLIPLGHAAIVAEPTELRLVIASKGALRWRIRVHGRSAHSSKPQLGINAIHHMARLVLALEQEHVRLASRTHPLLGFATGNVGVINGGTQVNIVPDSCVIEIDRRLLPGERVDQVLSQYQRVLDSLKQQHPDFDATMESAMLTDEALETSADAPPARVASEVLAGLGLNPQAIGVPFGSDASKLSRRGVPSLVFGPGSIDRAHAAAEYVEIDQVLQAFEFYRAFIRRFE